MTREPVEELTPSFQPDRRAMSRGIRRRAVVISLAVAAAIVIASCGTTSSSSSSSFALRSGRVGKDRQRVSRMRDRGNFSCTPHVGPKGTVIVDTLR